MKSAESLHDISTDLDAKTCQFRVAEEVDLESLLNELAEKDNKLKDWSLIQ